ncbi:MAG: hypothetical protein HXX08_24615 [Chloroflexi bacterium]|uniref:Uncharacterized protein n=1 Tax=Candidatus Chlorohelix allophototropha TaxID=3003348 RepID=A0A8T7MAM6_9CHLR|nr:hypothetical protein [Chloroflexota bacterium]WJW68981.1 hypothetical protein OZ401_002572 [Chloroflexota bacterium L227-S17]
MADYKMITACIDPQNTFDSDVPAYVAGAGRPHFVAHLEVCEFCRAEVSQYKMLESNLLSSLTLKRPKLRLDCPPSQLLGEYSLKLLTSVDKRKIEKHLKQCRFCEADYQNLISAVAEVEEPLQILEVHVPVVEKLRRIYASLVSGQPKLALRGGTAFSEGKPVSLDYAVEDLTIMLTLQPAKPRKGQMILSGTVLRDAMSGDELAGTSVSVIRGGKTEASESLDETGSFYFEGIQASSSFTIEMEFLDKVVIVAVEA